MAAFRTPFLIGLSLIGLAAILHGCSENSSQPIAGPSRSPVTITSCHPVAIKDERGHSVVGIEDMVIDHQAARVYLSAYDRRQPHDGARRDDRFTGGILRFPLSDLDSGTREIHAHTIHAGSTASPVRPHGIELMIAADKQRWLFVIDRSQGKDRKGRSRLLTLGLYDDGKNVAETIPPRIIPDLCNANNVTALSPENLYITNDRGACSAFGRIVENVMGLKNGYMGHLNHEAFQIVVNGLFYANGVERYSLPDDHQMLVVAETRGRALRFYDFDWTNGGHVGDQVAWIALKDGPDNITTGDDHALYVAALPNLFRYALFKTFNIRAADPGSHIYRVWTSEDGTELHWSMIGKVPSDILPGATVAAQTGEWLLVGSAYGKGIAQCQLKRQDKPL